MRSLPQHGARVVVNATFGLMHAICCVERSTELGVGSFFLFADENWRMQMVAKVLLKIY